jgi:4,5-DOPA dioxygenase extradiol
MLPMSAAHRRVGGRTLGAPLRFRNAYGGRAIPAPTLPLVYGLHAPNAPHLISPPAFGGVGAETVRAIESLQVVPRWRPDVILVASPHWVSEKGFRVHEGERPRQIYDFSGFPPQLSAIRYEPRGDPALAHQLVVEGMRRGIPVSYGSEWGLDHGAWAPLLYVSPGAKVPVVPLSISRASAGSHLAWGAAIRAALDATAKRAVFVSTGSITHSFRRMQSNPSATWTLGEQVEREILNLVLAQKYQELAHFDPERWRAIEPEGDLGPLFMLAGAAGSTLRPRLVATGQVFGAFGMSVIEFAPPAPARVAPPPRPPRARGRGPAQGPRPSGPAPGPPRGPGRRPPPRGPR